MQVSKYVGRFAPSPTGPLHFGSVIIALGSFLDARSQKGIWLLRIDDIDTARVRTGACDTIMRALEALGLHREEQSELAAFEMAVQNIPEVMECYLMTGEFDYLLRVVVSDMADFERLHNESLTRLPGVARVNSSVAIRTVQKTTELPLG